MQLTSSAFNRLVIGSVAMGFLAIALSGGAAVWALRQNQNYSSWVAHSYEVERAITEFRVSAERLEAARRGYMLRPGDTRFVDSYKTAAAAAPAQLKRIRELTVDNAAHQKNVEALGRWLFSDLVITDTTMDKVARGGQVAAIRDFQADTSTELLRNIRAITVQMSDEENQLLRARDEAQERTFLTLYGVLGIAVILLTFVGIGSLWVIIHYTRDLTASRNALQTLNEGLELAVRERTGDLKRANDEIQRFAYIVSHDLRSPLVNVMGFTSELESALAALKETVSRIEAENPDMLDEPAKDAVRTDLPEAIGFIRSSTQKMDRLINAILQLSRQGRRVLTPEPLDMTKLAQSVADSLRQRADQSKATIEVDDQLPDIVSDRIAVEQVLSNLVENAVKYSKPGQSNHIAIRGEERLGRVFLEVQDHGRGIDPKDHERVFELFRRSGAQDQAGEGIGLAHVRALVYRLGGVITVESALDQGSTFRVSLPARLMPEQGTA